MSKNKSFPYLHGFSNSEQARLIKQARFSEHKVYQNIDFGNANEILEVGCGVGAQSEILLRRFPEIKIQGIDLSQKQLDVAKENLSKNPLAQNRIEHTLMNAQKMSFESNTFDGAFLCWVLEHVPNPEKVLSEVRRVLRPGSKVYITEVMNSSFFLDPYSPNVWKFWMAFNDYQFEQAGDPFIGAKLGNLLMNIGFKDIHTEIKTWHLDNRFPEKRKETIDFWHELLLSGADTLIKESRVTEELVEEMKKEFSDVATNPNAVFYYSFVQATGTVY